MINLTTNCDECVHAKVCKHAGDAKRCYEKLKNSTFGDGPNDDYDWNVMSDHYNVTIDVSCPDFKRNSGVRTPNFGGVR